MVKQPKLDREEVCWDRIGEQWMKGMTDAELNGVEERVSSKKMIAECIEYPDNHFESVIGASFHRVEYRVFQLLEMIARVTGDRVTNATGLRALDTFLLKTFPSLARFCPLVVTCYTK